MGEIRAPFWFLFLFLLQGSGLSYASEKLERYNQTITYEQFEDLVRQKVKEIPAVANAFKYSHPNHTEYFFGGGRLRSLLGWIDNELLKGTSLKRLQKMPPPSLEELASQKDVDRDLLAIGIARKIDGWDVLPESFAKASRQFGGTTLEKVFIGQDKVVDPFGALKQFVKGNLEFQESSQEEYKAAASHPDFSENSRLAIALRFLRILTDFPNHQPTNKSRESILNLGESGDPFTWPASPENYWIHKGLLKLYRAHQDSSGTPNPARFIKTLKDWNLFDKLLQRGFSTSSKEEFIPIEELKHFKFEGSGLAIEDLPAIEDLLAGNSLERRLILKESFLPHCESPADFATVLDPGKKLNTRKYLEQIKRLAQRKLSENELALLKQDKLVGMREFLNHVTARDEKPGTSEAYILDHYETFLRYEPSAQQRKEVFSRIENLISFPKQDDRLFTPKNTLHHQRLLAIPSDHSDPFLRRIRLRKELADSEATYGTWAMGWRNYRFLPRIGTDLTRWAFTGLIALPAFVADSCPSLPLQLLTGGLAAWQLGDFLLSQRHLKQFLKQKNLRKEIKQLDTQIEELLKAPPTCKDTLVQMK